MLDFLLRAFRGLFFLPLRIWELGRFPPDDGRDRRPMDREERIASTVCECGDAKETGYLQCGFCEQVSDSW